MTITTQESPSAALTGNLDEAQLVAAAQSDPHALGALYDLYVERIYRYLLVRVGDPGEARDLTSEVFLDVVQGLPRYRPQAPFAAWLFTIARRRAVDHHRQRKTLPLDAADGRPASLADPLGQVLQAELDQQLALALAGLSEKERELLRLRFAAGLTFAEISALLKRSEGAVKKSLYRILARLQSQLEA